MQSQSNTGETTESSRPAYAVMRAYSEIQYDVFGSYHPLYYMPIEEVVGSPAFKKFEDLAVWLQRNNFPVSTGDQRFVSYISYVVSHFAPVIGMPAPQRLKNPVLLKAFCEQANEARADNGAPEPIRSDEQMRELYRKVFDPSMCTDSQFRRIGLL